MTQHGVSTFIWVVMGYVDSGRGDKKACSFSNVLSVVLPHPPKGKFTEVQD